MPSREIKTGAIVFCLLLCVLTSCAIGNKTSRPETKNYPHDGLMGMNSVNPNDPMNPTYHHYADDKRLVQQTLGAIESIRRSTILFNGRNMNITVEVSDQLSAEEIQRVEWQAQQDVSSNMPRYDVTVKAKPVKDTEQLSFAPVRPNIPIG